MLEHRAVVGEIKRLQRIDRETKKLLSSLKCERNNINKRSQVLFDRLWKLVYPFHLNEQLKRAEQKLRKNRD